MIRAFIVAFFVSCAIPSAWAQTQPAPGPTSQKAAASGKRVAKKPTQNGSAAAKPQEPTDAGPCQLGVVAAIDDKFAVQKIGITVFGNELAETPVEWGFNDIVVDRVRAAAPAGTAVRRIAYPRGAFDRYYNPPETLFGNSRGDFVAIVQQIIGNAHCERYIVIAGFQGTSADTHQPIKGIGIVNQGSKLFSATRIFANLMVQIFDGKTLEMQSHLSRLGSVLANAFKSDDRRPLGEVDNSAFPESAAAAAHNAMLRDRTRAVLAAHLDRILPAYLRPE